MSVLDTVLERAVAAHLVDGVRYAIASLRLPDPAPDGSDSVKALGHAVVDQIDAAERAKLRDLPAQDVDEYAAMLAETLLHRFRSRTHTETPNQMFMFSRIAGIAAHELSEALTIVMGRAEEALRQLDSARADVERVRAAAEQITILPSQLRVLSGLPVLQPARADLNQTIADAVSQVKRLVGGEIHVATRFASSIWPVAIDVSQFKDVLVSFAINAREAMPSGGMLKVTTTNEMVDRARAAETTLDEGEYVFVTIADQGVGIRADALPRIFEPYFSSKPARFGLGLTMSRAIIEQAGGRILVESKLRKGTTFTIVLPRFRDALAPVVVAAHAAAAAVAPTGAVLVVDDNDAVRTLSAQALRTAGYHVIEAGSGPEALQLCERHHGTIGVAVCDIVIPGMTGIELAEEMRKRWPKVQVIYVSGASGADGTLGEAFVKETFLFKPYALSTLLDEVRRATTPPRTQVAGRT